MSEPTVEPPSSAGVSPSALTPQESTIACQACAEPILAGAKKCKHCGEWQASLVGWRPPEDKRRKSPGLAVLFSILIPGAGQLYCDRVGAGLFWFFFVPGVWAVVWLILLGQPLGLEMDPVLIFPVAMIAGVAHLWCIIDAASGEASPTASVRRASPAAPSRSALRICTRCGEDVAVGQAACTTCGNKTKV